MASTTFTNQQTVVVSAWLNDVNSHVYNGYINVKNPTYGAVGDGTTDDTVAINAALTALPSGGCLYFPKGEYRLTSKITIPEDIKMVGDGKTVSLIKIDHTDVGFEKIYSTHTDVNRLDLVVSNLGFKGNSTSDGAFNLEKADRVSFQNVSFIDFSAANAYGVRIVNTYWASFSHCWFENIEKYGIRMEAASGVGCNSTTIGPRCQFIGNNQANFIAASLNGQNIHIFDNDFSGNSNAAVGIEMTNADGIHINDNYIERWNTVAIRANTATACTRIKVDNNVINSGASTVCDFNSAGTNSNVKFEMNRFSDLSGSQTCVVFGTTTLPKFIDNDTSGGIPSDINPDLTGLSAVVLTQTATWNPASMSAGASTAQNLTILGARVGDVATATLSTIGANDVLISAHVVSDNTVRCILSNQTGGVLDIASGTLRAWVFKN